MYFSEVHPFAKGEEFIKKYQGFGRMAQLLRASTIFTAGGGLVLSTHMGGSQISRTPGPGNPINSSGRQVPLGTCIQCVNTHTPTLSP